MNVKLLGVELDCKLQWRHHIQYAVKKGMAKLGAVGSQALLQSPPPSRSVELYGSGHPKGGICIACVVHPNSYPFKFMLLLRFHATCQGNR